MFHFNKLPSSVNKDHHLTTRLRLLRVNCHEKGTMLHGVKTVYKWCKWNTDRDICGLDIGLYGVNS